MATVFHTLTDCELLRRARTSSLMDVPLFAEIVDRFEADSERDSLNELRFQQVHLFNNPKFKQTKLLP